MELSQNLRSLLIVYDHGNSSIPFEENKCWNSNKQNIYKTEIIIQLVTLLAN